MKDRKQREVELHAKLAHEYDKKREGTKNGNYYSKEWLRTMLRKIKIKDGDTILDIGCGTGIFYEILKEEGLDCKYTGIDLSLDMINIGKKRYSGIDLRVMDCEHLEFPDHNFDVVFMRSVLHHIPDQTAAIKEMERVGKGLIIVSEPSRNVLTEIPRWMSKKFTQHFDKDHTHFSKKQIKTMLRTGGLGSAKFHHFGYLAYPFGFTDIVPGAKYMPMFLLKVLFKLDILISYVPLINYFSWHLIIVSDKKK